MTASTPRFVGLDVHKQSIVVSAVDAHQQVLLPARRVSLAEFESWATTHWQASAAVVEDARTTAWQFYDLLAPLVASVTVAHPFLIKLIARVACEDGRAGFVSHLAKLRASNLIPAVWVPSKPVRELRAILAHRRRITRATYAGAQSPAQQAASAQPASERRVIRLRSNSARGGLVCRCPRLVQRPRASGSGPA
jgi:hypothetical protein